VSLHREEVLVSIARQSEETADSRGLLRTNTTNQHRLRRIGASSRSKNEASLQPHTFFFGTHNPSRNLNRRSRSRMRSRDTPLDLSRRVRL